jgi:hypothetical protein
MHATKFSDARLSLVRPYSLLVIVATLAGCAGSMGTIRRPPPGPPPVTAFDGSYRITIVVAGAARNAADVSLCQTPGQPIVTIAGGKLSYAVPHPKISGNPTPIFQAAMAHDGSFSGQVPDGSLYGHIEGSYLVGEIDGVSCRYGVTGERI